MNAIYMQREALLTCLKICNIPHDVSILKKLPIFDYRDTFAAHPTTRFYGKKSFIMCRASLLDGVIAGVSANGNDEVVSMRRDMESLIEQWDEVLFTELLKVTNFIFDNSEVCEGKEKALELLEVLNSGSEYFKVGDNLIVRIIPID